MSTPDGLASLKLYRNAKPFKEITPISLKELLERRYRTYVFHSGIGDVVLRHLGYLEAQDVTFELTEKFPEYDELIRKAHEFIFLEQAGIRFSPQQEADAIRLGERLRKYQKYFAMRCFVTLDEHGDECPQFENLEAFDAFLTALTPDEQTRLQGALLILTQTNAGDMTQNDLALAEELKIPLADGLTLENMTAEQATVFMKAIKEKYDSLEKANG